MRKSGSRNGYTQVDHVTFDVVLPTLSTGAQVVFLRIYRQTVGWKKPFDNISFSQLREKTGIKQDKTIRRAVAELEGRDLIIVIGERTQMKTYGINWDEMSKYADQQEA